MKKYIAVQHRIQIKQERKNNHLKPAQILPKACLQLSPKLPHHLAPQNPYPFPNSPPPMHSTRIDQPKNPKQYNNKNRNSSIIKIKMFKFTQVAICKASVADNIDYSNPNNVKKSVKGDLQILLETTTGMMLLKMKDFQYGINPNDQILYEDKDRDWKLMLCLDSNPANVWILKINDNVELFFYMLSERCRLMHRRASRMIMEKAQTENKYPTLGELQRMKYEPQEQKKEDEKPQSTESKLIDASKSFSKFLAAAGLMLSKGLEMIGSYLSKKIDPSEHINLSPTTKVLIEKSVGASKKLLEFSTDKFAGVFRMATNQAVGLQSKLTKTDAGKKLKENGTIDSANHFLRVGFEALSNVYDGFVKGYDEATHGLSKGAKEVISAKYGQEAGDAALKLAEGYRNINKLPNVANEALKKVLIQTAKNQMVTKKQSR